MPVVLVKVMKQALCEIKNSWNSHYVRKSRHHTPSGIPDQLFFLPESVHAENHGKLYQQADIAEIERHITTSEDETHQLYQDYFQYNCAVLGLQEPNTWRDSFTLFRTLVEVAE